MTQWMRPYLRTEGQYDVHRDWQIKSLQTDRWTKRQIDRRMDRQMKLILILCSKSEGWTEISRSYSCFVWNRSEMMLGQFFIWFEEDMVFCFNDLFPLKTILPFDRCINGWTKTHRQLRLDQEGLMDKQTWNCLHWSIQFTECPSCIGLHLVPLKDEYLNSKNPKYFRFGPCKDLGNSDNFHTVVYNHIYKNPGCGRRDPKYQPPNSNKNDGTCGSVQDVYADGCAYCLTDGSADRYTEWQTVR
jgi:hypothetical protein